MSEEAKRTEQPEQKPEGPTEPQLSPRRRSALVTYLAILFAVAFLFVALMMVFETRRLKTMNQELQDNSQKNAATLTNNINALQEENRNLSGQNEALQTRLSELEAAAEAEQSALRAEIEGLTEAAAAKESEREALEAQVAELTQKAEDAVRVSELLHQALAADEAGELEELQSLLEEIEGLQELLSETEQEIYEELKIA